MQNLCFYLFFLGLSVDVLQESIKQLQVEVCCIEEAQNLFRTFSDWLSSAQNNFSTMAISISVVDRLTMERKMKTLEVQ